MTAGIEKFRKIFIKLYNIENKKKNRFHTMYFNDLRSPYTISTVRNTLANNISFITSKSSSELQESVLFMIKR